jgi:hypothetical protein
MNKLWLAVILVTYRDAANGWPSEASWFYSEDVLYIASALDLPHGIVGRLQKGVLTRFQPVGSLSDLDDPIPIEPEPEPEQIPIVGKRKPQRYSHERYINNREQILAASHETYIRNRDRDLPTVTEEVSLGISQ